MQLFYSTQVDDDLIVIDGEEHQHLVKSLRKKVGDHIHVTDGQGYRYKAVMENQSRNLSKLKIIEKSYHPSINAPLHIAISPLKNVSRFEWFLEKATEIGIHSILPIKCDHSEKNSLRIDRCEKIIVSAMKQSLQFNKPKLEELMDFDQAIESNMEQLIMPATSEKNEHLTKFMKGNLSTLIMIGPEGGFSEREINMAKAKNFHVVSMGKSRLRSETAGVAACTLYNQLSVID